MRILAFAASLRRASLNRRLLTLAAAAAREAGAEVDQADFAEFDMPLYNGDVETEQGLPAGCLKLVARLEAADAFMIAAPEYNHSYPGTLKNAIDWVSRARPMPFKGHIGYLLSASPSLVGGQRSLWHLRQPLESLGSTLMPFMYSLPQADKAFSDDGALSDGKRAESLTRQVADFIAAVGKLRGAA